MLQYRHRARDMVNTIPPPRTISYTSKITLITFNHALTSGKYCPNHPDSVIGDSTRITISFAEGRLGRRFPIRVGFSYFADVLYRWERTFELGQNFSALIEWTNEFKWKIWTHVSTIGYLNTVLISLYSLLSVYKLNL